MVACWTQDLAAWVHALAKDASVEGMVYNRGNFLRSDK